MIEKITNNFYQLSDVFSKNVYNSIIEIFNQDHSDWGILANMRLQYSLSVSTQLSTQIRDELKQCTDLAETMVGKLYQNGPQLWYDGDGYINDIHDGDVSPNHCVNIQIYFSDGDENMGTCCYDEEQWHQVPYKANCGYMLIGPTRVPHGMKYHVVGERLSLYQGFRNTEIPSNIW